MHRPDAIVQNITEQTQLIIEPISALVKNTADLLASRYSFGITRACDGPLSSGTDVVFEGAVYFKMSRKLPDSEPGDNPLLGSRFNCSVPIGAVGVQNIGQGEEACPEAQVPRNCSVSIDKNVTDQVSAVMQKAVVCPEKTWEGMVGLMGNCQSSGSGRIASAGLVTLAALLSIMMVS
jgi:hypothetical protein